MAHARRRRIVQRGLVALAAFFLALFAVEAVLRWTPLGERFTYRTPIYVGERENRESESFVPDALVGWRMRPGVRFQWSTEGRDVEYLAGDQGFRTGPGRDVAARPKRVALLGDSFAWGFGVEWEESCAALLEAELPDCAVDVLAMPGFGLDQIMASAQHWALPLEPDLVVVAIFSDDLSRCNTAYRDREGFNKPFYYLDGDGLMLHTTATRPDAARLFLEHRTRLFPALLRVRRKLGKSYGIGGWWALNAAFLDRIAAEFEAAAVPVLFVHIPKRNWEPMPALSEHLRERGADFVDLTDHATEPMLELYFENNGHFSARGHRYLARVMQDWIVAQRTQSK